jgi:predicted DCC family thiol-disulfide oxidoreductase YuxK
MNMITVGCLDTRLLRFCSCGDEFRDTKPLPVRFLLVTKALTNLMIAWEALFIPLVLWSRVTRFLAVGWGFLFICASSLLLSVQWPPIFEFLLWALLFWRSFGVNAQDRAALDVICDDRCNLCDRTVRFIRGFDLFRVARFRPVSDNKTALRQLGVPIERAMTDLVGVDAHTGSLFIGYGFYVELSKRILFLMPLWPVLVLATFLRVGPLLYRAVADHRTQWFGVCTRSSVNGTMEHKPLGVDRPIVMRVLCISYAIVAAFRFCERRSLGMRPMAARSCFLFSDRR